MTFVTAAEPGNVEAIAALVEEMDHFYGASDIEPLDLRIQQINDAVFTDPPAAYVLLAWEGDQLLGFASYSFLWPAAGLTRSLYLKELYVTQAYQRKGIGKLLMQHLSGIAVKHACSRFEWTTDQDNPDAQRFYELLGIPRNASKVFYRLDGDALRQAAASGGR